MQAKGRAIDVPGARRVAAFLTDYAVIAAYIGFLTVLGFAGRAALHLRLEPPRTAVDKLRGHAATFLILTVPVTLYFALSEASSAQATVGKRWLKLRVTTTDGRRVPLGHSMVRSTVKFVPWEIAHTAIWHAPGQPFVSPPAAWNVAGYLFALGAGGWYVVTLFSGDGRTPYDRVAGTVVIDG